MNAFSQWQRSVVELRHLRVFVALAEELHFGRAAGRLHLTQPSVSGQLQQLEAHLGVQLIRRNARQVSLTDAGQSFLKDARRVLRQADAAIGGVQRYQDGVSTSLRVGYLQDAVPEQLPFALRRTARELPRTRVLLSSGSPQTLLDDLHADLLDVVFVSLPSPVSGLRVTPVEFEHAIAAVPSNLDRDTTAPLELLAQRTLLTLPRRLNPAFYDSLVVGLQSAGLPGALVEVEAASSEAVLMEVACGSGCALVPESVTRRLRAPGVTFRKLAAEPAVGCWMAVVTRDGNWDPRVEALIGRVAPPAIRRSLAAA